MSLPPEAQSMAGTGARIDESKILLVEDRTHFGRLPLRGVVFAICALIAASMGAAWLIASAYYASRQSELVAVGANDARIQARNLGVSIRRSLHYISGVPDFFSRSVRVVRSLRDLPASGTTLNVEARRARWTRTPELNDLDRALALACSTFDVDLIFVLDAHGDAVAASNWDQSDSLIGTDFSDRAYFKANQRGVRGETYAVGRMTRVPGLFFSSPVWLDGHFAGSVVAKVNIRDLNFLLDQTDAFVTDQNGVIILAHRPEESMHGLRDAPIASMTGGVVNAIYRQQSIPILSVSPWGDAGFPMLLRIDGEAAPQLLAVAALPEHGLSVHAEMDLPRYVELKREQAGLFHILAALLSSLSLLALFAFIYLRSIRRARALLRRSELRFRTLERGTFEGVAISADGMFVDVNDQFLNMLGVSREDVIGRPITSLVVPEDRDKIRDYIARAPEGDVVEHGMLRKNGDRVIVEARGQALEHLGIPMRLTAIRDITERKLAETELHKSRELLRAFIDNAPIALAMLDRDMCYLAISQRWRTDYALAGREILGHSHYEIFPTLPDRWKAIYRRALDGERIRVAEDSFEREAGRIVWLSWEIWPWRLADGRVGGVVLATEDISERKLMQDALNKASLEAEDLYDHAPCGYFSVDALGTIVKANETLIGWIGKSRSDVIGQSIFRFIAATSQQRAEEEFKRFKLLGTASNVELDLLREDGANLPCLFDSTAVLGNDGSFVMSRTTVVDLRVRKELEHKLETLANTDPLTELSNRRNFMQVAKREIDRLQRFGGEISVLMLDLDHFKRVNDGFGHQAGDLVLAQFAKRCAEQLRSVDTMGRLGGEEFAVILPQTSRAHALEVAQRIRHQVETMEVRAGADHVIKVTASIGTASAAAPDVDFEQLLREADTALYQAKSLGRNRVCGFGESSQQVDVA
jgi:diguanylate cyclase (GGDEF)-like protein/PAS domain S-box-containing protein